MIRLDCLGVAAVGLYSNQASDEQVAKIIRITKRLAGGRVWLMQDCDSEGENGFKELLWILAQHTEVTSRPPSVP